MFATGKILACKTDERASKTPVLTVVIRENRGVENIANPSISSVVVRPEKLQVAKIDLYFEKQFVARHRYRLLSERKR